MQLTSFHVRKFRNIVDSGNVPVDQVTCLVGKNESGKSALLQALHALNPAKPPAPLNLLDEYPRWLKKQDEISGEITNAIPIEAEFQLSEEELREFSEKFGNKVLSGNKIIVSRNYSDAKLKFKINLDHKKFNAQFINQLPDPLKTKLENSETSQVLITGLETYINDPQNSGSTGTKAEKDEAARILTGAQETLAKIKSLFGANSYLTQAAESFFTPKIPRTFYFSKYSQLRARYELEQVVQATQTPSLDEEIQAAADFLKLARAVPTDMANWEFEAQNAELESISTYLTANIKDHWHQNEHLNLKVNIEIQQPLSPGEQPSRFLQFRVEDTRHGFTSRLDRRSTGFQWFVSFLASFLEFETDKNLILLLDEPGLSLHARAQLDLLETIESKLALDRQVLYSTHSPFLVKTSLLNQVRIVEDQGREIGSRVISDAGSVTDIDTLFPLQAALGYDIAQSIFIGEKNLLVEGTADFLYLTMISEHLSSLGRKSLPSDCRILPVGSSSKIPTFIALLGSQLEVVVLVDGGVDTQKLKNLVSQSRMDDLNIFSLNDFSTIAKADIEDLFSVEEYLQLFNGAFNQSIEISNLEGTDRIVSRLTRHLGSDFNHGHVASYFLKNSSSIIPSLSTETLQRFENLFTSLDDALSKL